MRRSTPRRRTSPWVSAPRRRELLRALPKTDLHVHLDGSLRPATLLELAAAQGAKLPFRTPRELSAAFAHLASGVSLPEYLKAFDWTLAVLQDRASLERVAFELAEDAFMENVRYMEVRYCPALHTRKGTGYYKVPLSKGSGIGGITCMMDPLRVWKRCSTLTG